MAIANAAGFGGNQAALPIQPSLQNGASFASPIAPVVTNNTIAPPAPISPAVAMAATGAAAHMASQAPPVVTNGAAAMQPQAPIVQNPQNGYMPGPQQVQGLDGNPYNAQFGSVDYDPFANAISGGQNSWK